MKILLIDNNTVHKKPLLRALHGHDVEVQLYKPGINFNDHNKDLVILSGGGGEGREIADIHEQNKLWYEDEMEFVRTCQIPVLGICMGFEVMAKAHGQEVPQLNKLIYEQGTLSATKEGWRIFGKQNFKQSEAHSWHVPVVPRGFEELVRSENGVEVMHSSKFHQIGTQFHPELNGTLKLDNLIAVVV